jgi:hypothetical protein
MSGNIFLLSLNLQAGYFGSQIDLIPTRPLLGRFWLTAYLRGFLIHLV